MTAAALRYPRVLLKLSGEALMGEGEFGIDAVTVEGAVDGILELVAAGVQVGLVLGGGNIFRGAALARGGLDRVTADHMGMLATVMNALAMSDFLVRRGQRATVMSAIPMGGVCEPYDRRRAVTLLEDGHVMLFTAGTGNPFFTTDSAASLRAIEVGADLLVKATKVNGVYAADPVTHPDAERFVKISYDEVIRRRLAVMDTTAIVLCRDHGMPLKVVDMGRPGSLMRAVRGEDEGTLVYSDD